MFKKGLIVAMMNPLHHGHIALIKSGLKYTDSIDVYLGSKPISDLLPYEVRKKALMNTLEYNGLERNVNIIKNNSKQFKLNFLNYDVLIAGSCFLNHMDPLDGIFRDVDKNIVRSFKNIVMLEKMGQPLSKNARKIIKKHSSLIECSPKFPYSSREIRKKWKDGEDISTMIPKPTLQTIENYLNIFE